MYNSTLGYYSFMISKKITEAEAKRLAMDFSAFNYKTNELDIRPNERYPDNYTYFYRSWNKGLFWNIRSYMDKVLVYDTSYSPTYDDPRSILRYARERTPKISFQKEYVVEAHINPLDFVGRQGDITDDAVDVYKIIEDKFNQEAIRISRALGELSSYELKWGRYYVDFDLTKLGITCTSEQMLALLNAGNLPFDYENYVKYNEAYCHDHPSHIDNLNSICESITIDCKLIKARNAIRFEVKCDYKSSYSVSQYLKENSAYICHDILCDCFTRAIMWGNYYTLNQAIDVVLHSRFNKKKENNLIDALMRVDDYSSISKAKDSLYREERVEFFNSLRALASLGINPVTLPKDLNIKFVQNLLDAHINGPYG